MATARTKSATGKRRVAHPRAGASHETLREKLSALESKVRYAVDWRRQYQKAPATFLAIAAGGGLLVALAASRLARGPAPAPDRFSLRGPKASPLDHAVDDIKGALVALATAELRTALSGLLPGLDAKFAGRTSTFDKKPVAANTGITPPPGPVPNE
jgi:hypothetical protein